MSGEIAVNIRDDYRALSDCRGDSLDRVRAHITYRVHTRDARGIRSPLETIRCSSENEPLLIQLNCPIEPTRVRLSADHDEDGPDRLSRSLASLAVCPGDELQG